MSDLKCKNCGVSHDTHALYVDDLGDNHNLILCGKCVLDFAYDLFNTIEKLSVFVPLITENVNNKIISQRFYLDNPIYADLLNVWKNKIHEFKVINLYTYKIFKVHKKVDFYSNQLETKTISESVIFYNSIHKHYQEYFLDNLFDKIVELRGLGYQRLFDRIQGYIK